MDRVLAKAKGGLATKQTVVVIIDDSETVRKILEVCLHRAGYEDVRAFPDALAFLRWLRTPEARILSLVIVDLNLPQMDGYSLIQHLKAKTAFARTVFVILTCRHSVLDRLKGRLIGAQVYLTKPFRTQDITAMVAHFLGSAQIEEPEEAWVQYQWQQIRESEQEERQYARYV